MIGVESTDWSAAPVPEQASNLEQEGHPPWLARLLARRGVTDGAGAASFLAPAEDQLHDPAGLEGMDEAVARLRKALDRGERVAIVGDYDVDGVAATAILTAVFSASGLENIAILPHRLREGYGFQPVHVERAQEKGCSVIVTADCGTTAHEAVAAAKDSGVDVVVTDHHLPERPLPEETIEINPHRDSCSYPFTDLSGAGLAFKLAVAFAHAVEQQVPLKSLLRMAALGTICDLVPLIGENRVIAALGLAALPETHSAGLQALIQRAGIRPPFMAADVGFRIGPRINAAGRLDDPQPALDLLLTRDRERAWELANHLEELNRKRQAAEARIMDDARELLVGRSPLPSILLAWSPDWERGVVGVAAGRLARELSRPTVLLSVDGEQATGSGRSLPGIELHRFLEPWRSQLVRFGGHSQAVGLTAPTDRLEVLQQEWEEKAAATWEPELFRRRFEYELDLEPAALNAELLAGLDRLEPFGIGNQQPLIRVGPLSLDGSPRLFGRGHLAARSVSPDGAVVELLGWGWQERLQDLQGRFEALGSLEADRYRQTPVLRLKDSRPFAR
ncbi:MAG: single-stranded-DNA-specific exonuclease RecJ [Acidobacteria bacterium]|nr:MAG: single-stranded-DNA-specific exonuclease RecJ [Acidobacteriota bacterium]